MAQNLPDLPLELLLDIIEMLLASGDWTSRASAAHLAQTCTALRSAEIGKQARYVHALASLSMSVPDKLPANLDYETEVLLTARWPHQAPLAEQPEQATESLHAVCESFLSPDGYVGLSLDRKSIMCFSDLAASSSAAPAPHSHATCLEHSVLRRTIELRGTISAWAVDESRI